MIPIEQLFGNEVAAWIEVRRASAKIVSELRRVKIGEIGADSIKFHLVEDALKIAILATCARQEADEALTEAE